MGDYQSCRLVAVQLPVQLSVQVFLMLAVLKELNIHLCTACLLNYLPITKWYFPYLRKTEPLDENRQYICVRKYKEINNWYKYKVLLAVDTMSVKTSLNFKVWGWETDMKVWEIMNGWFMDNLFVGNLYIYMNQHYNLPTLKIPNHR